MGFPDNGNPKGKVSDFRFLHQVHAAVDRSWLQSLVVELVVEAFDITLFQIHYLHVSESVHDVGFICVLISLEGIWLDTFFRFLPESIKITKSHLPDIA